MTARTVPGTTVLYTTVGSPLGDVLLVGRVSVGAPGGTALVSLSLEGQKGAAVVPEGGRCEPAAFEEIAGQLEAYFEGGRRRFEIEYADGGTEFQRRVWRALEEIPYGETVSYGEIAARVGAPGVGVRAVGTAIGRNPLLVVRPCHRVIGADGALRGYAGGLERKKLLLGLEGAAGCEGWSGLEGAAGRPSGRGAGPDGRAQGSDGRAAGCGVAGPAAAEGARA